MFCVTPKENHIISSLIGSVVQLTLRHPVDCIMPGLPVHHQLPELMQTHVL